MANFTAYKVSSLPTSNIDENGLYFKKESGDNFYTSHLRTNGNWVALGIVDSVESINGLTGDTKIDLSFTGGNLKIVATGDGTAATVATITIIDDNSSGANKTYSSNKINSLIQSAGGGDMMASMYDQTNIQGDAFNYNNFYNTPTVGNGTISVKIGAQTVGSFSMNQTTSQDLDLSPIVVNVIDNLTSTSATSALSANQGKVLKDLIDGLQNTVSSGINLQGGYNANTETSFPPNTTKGDAWYITNAGTIQGETFEIGDMIIANKDDASTTSTTDWIFIQANIGQATESTVGYAKIATTVEAQEGTDDTNIMTAKKVKTAIEEFSQVLAASTSIDITSGQIRTKAITGDVTVGANARVATIANNAVSTAKIANKAVTYAKMQDVTSKRLLGRHSNTNGVTEEVSLAENLKLEDGKLSVVWGSEEW